MREVIRRVDVVEIRILVESIVDVELLGILLHNVDVEALQVDNGQTLHELGRLYH